MTNRYDQTTHEVTNRDLILAKLGDRTWRLTSGVLYKIVSKEGNVIPFIPTEIQKRYLRHKHKKNIVLKARQIGLTTVEAICALDYVLFSKNKQAGVIAHDIGSATDIFENKIRFAFDNLPKWLQNQFETRTDRKGEMRFSNGGVIAVDTSFRSSTLQKLHISEYAKLCNSYPEKAREVQTGALNTIGPGQEVTIESTAEGSSGFFFDMCRRAMEQEETGEELTDMDYKFHFFPWYLEPKYHLKKTFELTSGTIDYFNALRTDEWFMKKYPDMEFSEDQMAWWQKKYKEQGEDMLREFPSTPKEAFQLAIKGAYFEKELGYLRQEQRLCRVPYDTKIPVHTSWDIGGAGGGDDTVIWYFQVYGREIRVIDYWEGSGYSMLDCIAEAIRPKRYSWGTHFLPHDAEVHEYTTGKTRILSAREAGLHARTLPKLNKADQINEARNMLGQCWFNVSTTEKGLGHLGSYRREWDERKGIYKDKPHHDEHSHAADSFMYLAQSVKLVMPYVGG